MRKTPAAVFFDVDFTLIRPGHRFLGPGYAETCARHGVTVDQEGFETAVGAAAELLDTFDARYHDEIFVRYTARIIEHMGGSGPGVSVAAREIYADWACHEHFEMYDDVPDTLRALERAGMRLGLISNSHRPLQTFAEHFAVPGLLSVTVSSAEFGFMKPDRRIFEEALRQMDVDAADAVMVGDSLAHDVIGARQVGMRGVLVDRADRCQSVDTDIAVIRSLTELADLL
jgi:HAD superfamily hydrolase (TIGR01662 family)